MENTPLVKFVRNYIRDRSLVFSVSVFRIGDVTLCHCKAENIAKCCLNDGDREAGEENSIKPT